VHWDFTSQAGVIAHAQALAHGITHDQIRVRLTSGRWQRLHRGIYATFPGEVPRAAQLWAAVLVAGDGAVLSHQAAAEAWGMSAPQQPIHVTIPHSRKVTADVHGVVVHRSRQVDPHPAVMPPRTRIEETVLDVALLCTTVDDAIAWLIAACQQRRTTATRLRAALATRSRVHWRAELMSALADIDDGAQSLLEVRYLRNVERAHALPCGLRQTPRTGFAGKVYHDVEYADFATIIELDGRIAHPMDAAHRDLVRDNAAAIRRCVTLHYGWDQVSREPCRVAAQVAKALADGGWTGRGTACRRANCDLGQRRLKA
jgi:hypothetical protein